MRSVRKNPVKYFKNTAFPTKTPPRNIPQTRPARRFLFLILLFIVCFDVNAETVIKTSKILDVESGKWLKDKVLVVENERIKSIIDLEQSSFDSYDIDLSGYHVLPGLIDAHVHLTSSANLHGYRRLSRSVPRAAVFGVSSAKKTLAAGFTTVRNVGAPGFADVALRDAINEGEIPGPRMRVAGRTICITGGHCDGGMLAPEYKHRSDGAADGPWEVKARVRENIKYGADLIKFTASGGVLSKGTDVNASQFSFEEMKSLIEEAHDRGRHVAAHAHGRNGILRAIRAGVDSIEHASFIDSEGIKLAKKSGTSLVMDIYVSDYILSEGEKVGILPESLAKERMVGRIQRENFKRAHEAGVNIVFGTDAGVYPHGLNARQFAFMVEWGMTELEAIQAATIRAAELLNWRDADGKLNVGVLVEGSFADLIALNEDPLKNIRTLENVEHVIKGGRLEPTFTIPKIKVP